MNTCVSSELQSTSDSASGISAMNAIGSDAVQADDKETVTVTGLTAKNKNIPAEQSLPDQVCYEAYSESGSVFIAAHCQSEREWLWHSLASAILLERLEDACRLAETLLDTSLQFFVSELPIKKESGKIDYITVCLHTDKDDIQIWLPATEHTSVFTHTDVITQENLRWSALTGVLKLATVKLNEEDIDRLASGSLLLIPAAWQPAWQCQIDIVALRRKLNVVLDPQSGSLDLSTLSSLNDACTDTESGQGVVEVYIEQTLDVDPRYLLPTDLKNDIQDRCQLSMPSIAIAQLTCRCVVDSTKTFNAELVPIGRGYGLFLKEDI